MSLHKIQHGNVPSTSKELIKMGQSNWIISLLMGQLSDFEKVRINKS